MNNQIYTCLVLKKILITPRLRGGNILDCEERFLFPSIESLQKKQIQDLKEKLKQTEAQIDDYKQKQPIEVSSIENYSCYC
jgi:hypothetical protein